MKKLLAICSIFFTVCTAFTSCGSDDTTYDSNDGTTSVTIDDNSVGEHVSDAINGVGEAGGNIIVTDVRPGLVDTAMAKGEGLFWVMPVEKVARQICAAISLRKSKVYVTKRWHILAVINKNLPFSLYKRM